MTHRVERLALPFASPGTRRELVLHRFGTLGARPKAYLQASLHADEPPGMLVLQHLVAELQEAERTGAITGEIAITPYANPIGLAQWMAGQHMGRFESASGNNFNRGFPDLTDEAAARIDGRLGADGGENAAIIRLALLDALDTRAARSELAALRLALLRLSLDADVVLDLHCDEEALLHIYVAESLWPDAADLSAQLGSRATLLADSSGGEPFDEAHSLPWIKLRARFGARHPIPLACLAATIELRGHQDLSDAQARADAENLYRFLQRRGVIAGDPGDLPAACCDGTPFTGVDPVHAPAGGIICFTRALGDHVKAGEVVAEILDPAAADPAQLRHPVLSRADGILFTRCRNRLARPGMTIAKVAGRTPLPHRTGALLED